MSDGGAQLAPFNWGSAELVRYRSADGVQLQAALYKPANFDPKKKYPVIVYLYERLSQTVHSFVNPTPGTSINTSFYVSNGYVVLMPDIVYKTGQPGQSALRCVLPALDAIVAFMGRIPNRLHAHANRSVSCGRGRRAGWKHDECVLRHSLGQRIAASVPV